MSTKRIDGVAFDAMLRNGLACLRVSEEKINILNVFPVADGDTGTNMRLTLENGLRTARPVRELNVYLKAVSEGMLYGARGNSGVILSQLFSGVAQELSRTASAGTGELKNAFYRAYRVAYASVVRPVEGTILTVAREGIEHIRPQIRRDTTVEQFFSMYVAEMRKSLAATPELLPELKEAGVVDSGAMGYIEIVDGMLKYLYGEILEEKPVETPPPQEADLSLFDENSVFADGYCMEFILQRMNGDAYDAAFRLPAFVAALESMGGSIAAVENGRRVKVHVHTHRPEAIIALCRRYGEFLTFKLENMQVQHNERDASVVSTRGHKPLAVVSVVSGQGMRELFTGVGCDELLEGGATMNASAQDFVSAIGRADADTIVLLPNDKNTLLAAKQAVTLSRAENVVILPTRSMVEGYFALAMDVPDSTDVEYRLRQMRLGAKNVLTLSAATALRDSAYHGVHCRAGDCVAFLGGEPAAADKDRQSAVLAALAGAEGLSDRESCIIFRGRDAGESETEALAAAIGEKYPHLEVETLYGGQSVYAWLIGIV